MASVRIPTGPVNPDPRPTCPLPPPPPRPAAEELEQLLAGMAPAEPVTPEGLEEMARWFEAEAILDSHFHKTVLCVPCGGTGYVQSGSWCRECGGIGRLYPEPEGGVR